MPRPEPLIKTTWPALATRCVVITPAGQTQLETINFPVLLARTSQPSRLIKPKRATPSRCPTLHNCAYLGACSRHPERASSMRYRCPRRA
ncbi:hypothetical protein RSAG8_13168, partial [Rhizoctonia solani AG-8 WAC10335]